MEQPHRDRRRVFAALQFVVDEIGRLGVHTDQSVSVGRDCGKVGVDE